MESVLLLSSFTLPKLAEVGLNTTNPCAAARLADGRTALTITKETVSGSAFSVSGLSVPKTIQPATSITVTAKFAPEASGAFSGYK